MARNSTINLNKTYTRNEKYMVEINYTAKPNELAAGGSDAITQDKGLYFINPLGEEPGKPTPDLDTGRNRSQLRLVPDHRHARTSA